MLIRREGYDDVYVWPADVRWGEVKPDDYEPKEPIPPKAEPEWLKKTRGQIAKKKGAKET